MGCSANPFCRFLAAADCSDSDYLARHIRRSVAVRPLTL